MTVAVIDSGITPSGDIDNIIFFDFTRGGVQGYPSDDYGHGTHIAGLIGSDGDYSNGKYAGMAPDVRYVALKVLDETGAGLTSNVINAINFAVAKKNTFGIDIINLSLGHPIFERAATDPLVRAVENAAAAGIVVVAAAGNFGGDPDTHAPGYAGITSPGNAPNALTVGAVDTANSSTRSDDVVAWYSSRGPSWYDAFQKPDIVAPGSKLVSNASTSSTLYQTYPDGTMTISGKPFLRLSGTSMSAGVVSGAVALMIEAHRTRYPGVAMTPNAVKAVLQYTALPIARYDALTQGA